MNDESLADSNAIEDLSGVVKTISSGGQYQVVIGTAVADVYEALMTELEGEETQRSISDQADGKKAAADPDLMDEKEKPGQGKNILRVALGKLSAYLVTCMQSLIPVLASAGMIRTIAMVLGPTMLGWLDVPLADIAVSAFSIVLLFNTIRRDYEPVTLSNTFRFSVFILSAISAVLMICGMIITWTPITWTAAEGVQGRYFLLLLFPILLSFRGKTFTANEKCDKICISVQFAALVFTSIFMLLRLM